MKSHFRGSIRALLLAGVSGLLAMDLSLFAGGAEAVNAGSSSAARSAGFSHVVDRQVPRVTRTSWVRNPIDSFVLAKLESEEIAPAAPASREALIRRAYFDLIGLPPTPVEVDEFVNDPAPDAFERVVDRLLASPQYGERWARHWLDLAHYAESEGFKADETRPNAWRYRDWVIGALNSDKPYDRFVKEQIAGDELYPDDPNARI